MRAIFRQCLLGISEVCFTPVSLQVINHHTQSEEYVSLKETKKVTQGSPNYVSLASVCRLGLKSLTLDDSYLSDEKKCTKEKILEPET